MTGARSGMIGAMARVEWSMGTGSAGKGREGAARLGMELGSMPRLEEIASWACIWAVTAAAAMAAEPGRAAGPPPADTLISLVSGGVMAMPTLSSIPPRSNRFIAEIASWQAILVSYSMYP